VSSGDNEQEGKQDNQSNDHQHVELTAILSSIALAAFGFAMPVCGDLVGVAGAYPTRSAPLMMIAIRNDIALF
jgi:hypothetical protein